MVILIVMEVTGLVKAYLGSDKKLRKVQDISKKMTVKEQILASRENQDTKNKAIYQFWEHESAPEIEKPVKKEVEDVIVEPKRNLVKTQKK